MAVLPFETNPELLVYPDAVLIFPVTTKTFQTICRWDCKLTDFSNTIYLIQLALSNRPQRSGTATSRQPGVSAVKYVFCTLVAKGLYHTSYYNGIHYNSQLLIPVSGLNLKKRKGRRENNYFHPFLWVRCLGGSYFFKPDAKGAKGGRQM